MTTYTLTFQEPQAVPNRGADFRRYSYGFTIIDSAFIGTPEESAHLSYRSLWVTACPENTPWRGSHLSESDLMQVLFHYGVQHITELIRKDTLPTGNPIEMPMIYTSNTPQCPITDIRNIPTACGHTIQVEQERRMGF